ncbi:hypothetical protein [Serratia fonticola]|uniref:hypothetical protein n=1 Tax=Serratia fonticola TaxID=47917 RepID=UPI0027F6FA9D|nr:hypothetical protein [Serratia fonticola]MDQ7208479.1 hypothetical protein [Serratia fonticola]HBE9078608.1 hypothetical protein [Serratia fonticola]HBE9151700.1 hypothetical protein [Serratia fonticola]
MSKDIFDASRQPINRTAALVLGKGFAYQPKKKIQTADQPNPIRVRFEVPPNLKKFIGKKFGRMTVIGLAYERRGRWVVRCTCGTYTLRKLKSINNPENRHDCCEQCRQLNYLKCADHFRRTGKEIEWGDL